MRTALALRKRKCGRCSPYYALSSALPEVKEWYDGYLFNRIEIYNPWSILKYVNDRKDHVTQFALPYWSNTSSNSIIREMVGEADEEAKEDLETLINGGTIEKRVHGGYHLRRYPSIAG